MGGKPPDRLVQVLLTATARRMPWDSVAPYLDQRVMAGAAKVGLPRQPAALCEAAGWKHGQPGSGMDLARLAGALVRVSASA